MSPKATIYKVELDIADMDRNYFAQHAETLAQHPDDTTERLMLKILAFARHATEGLTFSQGLYEPNEPDIYAKDLTGQLTDGIIVGDADETSLKRLYHKAHKQAILVYLPTEDVTLDAITQKWQNLSGKFNRVEHLTVWTITLDELMRLTSLFSRTMHFNITIQDNHAWVASDNQSVEINFIDLNT